MVKSPEGIFRNCLGIEQKGICDLYGIFTVAAKKKLRIIKVIKIVNRLLRTELNPLNLLEINVVNILSLGRLSAEVIIPVEERFIVELYSK